MELSTGGSGKVVALKCDVSKEEEVLTLFERVKEMGGADVLVCNAGLAHSEPLLSGDTSQWREMIEVWNTSFPARADSCLVMNEVYIYTIPLTGECDRFVCVQP